MSSKEEWRDVVGYEGLYQVSNLGRVKCVEHYTSDGKLLKPHIMRQYKDRYMGVHLSNSGKVKTVWVHRLVAEAFIPNPSNLATVNHKDENKENNNVLNLEWMSQHNNNLYNGRNWRAGFKHRKQVTFKSIEGHTYTLSGAIEFIELFGVSRDKVYKCLAGKQRTAGGYKLEYEL